MKSLRIVLLQARVESDPIVREELESFARHCDLPVDSFTVRSVVEPAPMLSELRAYDAIMVGGAGEFLISKGNLPHQEAFLDLLREIVAARRAMFASCFGFQALVQALGGEVRYAPERTEVGTFDLELTAAGQQDELLGVLPPRFTAQMGRKDLAHRLPDGASNLALSEFCPHQALRIDEAPIWATQFHPELDHTTNRSRFERYVESYRAAMGDEEIERSLRSYRPSPETAQLLGRFLRLVFQ